MDQSRLDRAMTALRQLTHLALLWIVACVGLTGAVAYTTSSIGALITDQLGPTPLHKTAAVEATASPTSSPVVSNPAVPSTAPASLPAARMPQLVQAPRRAQRPL